MATAVVKAEQAEVDNLRINQILAARLRNRWIMAPTPSTRHLLDGVEVPVPPLDGASPSAFSTVHPTQCDFHTGDNLQMRQAGDVRSRAVRLPARV